MKKQIKKMVAFILAITLMVTMYVPVLAQTVYAPKYTGEGGLVDGLKAVGVDSSFERRSVYAELNGFPSPYTGDAGTNLALLGKLKNGTLIIANDTAESMPDNPLDYPTITSIGFDEEYDYIEVTKASSVRVKASKNADVKFRCESGTVLKSTGNFYNSKLNKWYRVILDDGTNSVYYIYSGNVKKHVHETADISVNGITYKVCECGSISAESTSYEQEVEISNTLGITSAALPMIAADGPLPFGDVAATVLLLVSAYKALGYAAPAVKEVVQIVTDSDFSDYLQERSENTCSQYSFRRVARFPGGLKYTDHYCMDPVEAYLYVTLVKGDIYTADEDSALILAAMFGSAIMERDKAAPTKDITTYFYHYHVGLDRVNKAHIFFGTNDLGQGPV